MAQEHDSVGGGGLGAASGALSGVAAGSALGPIGMVVGGLLGAITGGRKTKVPKPPTYQETLEGALKGQEGIQPRWLDLERQYRPEWQHLGEQTYMNQLMGGQGNLGYLDLVDRARVASRPYEEQATLDELMSTQRLSPLARQALMSEGQKRMNSMLGEDAMNRVAAGTGLTGADERQAQQDAREAMAARGLGGRQAVAFEVLKNNALGIKRRDSALSAAYDWMKGETAFQNQANEAAQMGKNFMTNYGKLYSSSDAFANPQGKVFNPQDSMNVQAMGQQYQHGMGMARSNLAQQQGFLNALGSFGKFAAANPSMFDFSNPFSLGTPTQPPSASTPLGTNNTYYDLGLTNSFWGNNTTAGGSSW